MRNPFRKRLSLRPTAEYVNQLPDAIVLAHEVKVASGGSYKGLANPVTSPTNDEIAMAARHLQAIRAIRSKRRET